MRYYRVKHHSPRYFNYSEDIDDLNRLPINRLTTDFWWRHPEDMDFESNKLYFPDNYTASMPSKSEPELVGRAVIKTEFIERLFDADLKVKTIEKIDGIYYWIMEKINEISIFIKNVKNGKIKEVPEDHITEPVTMKDLTDYGEIYIRMLNTIYDDFKFADPIISDKFVVFPIVLGVEPEIEIPDNLSEMDSFLLSISEDINSSLLQEMKKIIFYHKNIIFIRQPNQKCFWSRRLAVWAANGTFRDLFKQGK